MSISSFAVSLLFLGLGLLTSSSANCFFPDFLLIHNTNTWWSGTFPYNESSIDSARIEDKKLNAQVGISFPQLTVRHDLQKLVITFPWVSAGNQQTFSREHRFFAPGQTSDKGQSHSITVTMRCETLIDQGKLIYLAEVLKPNTRLVCL